MDPGAGFHGHICVPNFTKYSRTYSSSLGQPGQFTLPPAEHGTFGLSIFSLIFDGIFIPIKLSKLERQYLTVLTISSKK